jgi:hypothetical protein
MIDFESMVTQKADDLPIGNYTMGKQKTKLFIYPTVFISLRIRAAGSSEFANKLLRQLPKCRPC